MSDLIVQKEEKPRMLRTILAISLIVAIVCLGYGFYSHRIQSLQQVQSSPSPSNQRLVKVVFDKDYVSRMSSSPQKFAKTFRLLANERVHKTYAKTNGDVVLIVTRGQRKKIINNFKIQINGYRQNVVKENRQYRYSISDDYKHLNAWLDEKVSMDSYGTINSLLPYDYSFLYYLEGHKGPWDMTIRIYNCHSGKLRLSFSYWKQPHVVWPLKILK